MVDRAHCKERNNQGDPGDADYLEGNKLVFFNFLGLKTEGPIYFPWPFVCSYCTGFAAIAGGLLKWRRTVTLILEDQGCISVPFFPGLLSPFSFMSKYSFGFLTGMV